MNIQKLKGSQIVIETLIEQGVTHIFGYPGGQVLQIYDQLYNNADRITHVLTAHEQGAAHAADGYARASGKVGVVRIERAGEGAPKDIQFVLSECRRRKGCVFRFVDDRVCRAVGSHRGGDGDGGGPCVDREALWCLGHWDGWGGRRSRRLRNGHGGSDVGAVGLLSSGGGCGGGVGGRGGATLGEKWLECAVDRCGEDVLCRAKPGRRCVVVDRSSELRNLDEGEFDEQPFVLALTIVEVAVGALADGCIEEARLASLCLLAVALAHLVGCLEQTDGLRVLADEEVAQMGVESADKMTAFESLGEYLVEGE